jgi:hypothetical protein
MANGLLSDGQSYLEKTGIEERNEQLTQQDNGRVNTYYSKDEYKEGHANTYASNGIGKGVDSKGTEPSSATLPHEMTQQAPDQSRFAYSDTNEPGNSCDRSSRSRMMARQLYGPGNEYNYGDNVIDTSKNVSEGQFDINSSFKPQWTCPVV